MPAETDDVDLKKKLIPVVGKKCCSIYYHHKIRHNFNLLFETLLQALQHMLIVYMI